MNVEQANAILAQLAAMTARLDELGTQNQQLLDRSQAAENAVQQLQVQNSTLEQELQDVRASASSQHSGGPTQVTKWAPDNFPRHL